MCLYTKKETGVKPIGPPFVLSERATRLRQHLPGSKRAKLAVEIEPLFAEEAKQRQRLSEGRGQKGKEKIPYLNGNGRNGQRAGDNSGGAHPNLKS